MAAAAPFPKTNLDLIARLQRLSSDVLADLIPGGATPALLDFPNYDNVGDSAIYLGELAYLKRRGIRPRYVAATLKTDFAAMRRAISDSPILLTGGGNFGDLWPGFQPHREEVLTRFKGHPVVQLPQTIHFSSPARIEQTARIVAAHGAFTLLVRDQASYDLARRHFDCETRLCPDMAFHMGPLTDHPPRRELMMLMRADQEAATDRGDLAVAGDVLRADWPRELKPYKWSRYAAMAAATAVMRPFQSLDHHKELRYALLARARMRRGLGLLGQGRTIVTDRLHGHILAILLGRPQAIIDNRYGKVSGLMNQWGTRLPNVHVAATVGEAIAVLREREGLAL